jgi:hypothetical protein
MKTEIFRVNTNTKIELIDQINLLPWWLFDRIPQGFAGRVYAKQILKNHPEYPKDPNMWSDEIALTLLAQYPIDAIGNFLIGEKDLNRYQKKTIASSPVSMNDLPALAEQSKARCCTLLSGEQPKFCCDLMSHGPCIVKFAETQKQADLLIAEHIALSILSNAGICASNSILTHIDQYQFLVIRRFDCMEHSGRRGVVSLKSLDLEFVGSRDQRWPIIAEKLAEQNIIAKSELNTIQKLFCFGRLIANSDMHTGNLSFFNDGIMPFVLTPAYDMLPMAYANFDVKQSSSRITIDSDIPDIFWFEVLPLALSFWQMLGEREDLSDSFRNISLNMSKHLPTIT